jgi:hypothetical protein
MELRECAAKSRAAVPCGTSGSGFPPAFAGVNPGSEMIE